MADTPTEPRDVMAAMPTTATHRADVTPTAVAEFAHAVIDELRQEYRDELEHLRRENQQLAGQLGFTQAKLQDAQEENQQLRLLMAPKDEPSPEPPAEPERRPWWKRILR